MKRLIWSQVWYGEECFFVTTAETEYKNERLETVVSEYNEERKARGKVFGVCTSDSIEDHYVICEELRTTGKFKIYLNLKRTETSLALEKDAFNDQ